MKKLFLIAVLLVAAVAIQAQTKLMTVANGSVGVDSVGVGDTQNTYYYINGSSGTQNSRVHPNGTKASQPITQHEVAYVLLGGVHSLVTETDSLLLSFEVSIDNTAWIHVDLGIPSVTATGTSVITGGTGVQRFAVKDLAAYAIYKITSGTLLYPYYRVKMIHMKATGNIYPKAFVVLKQL
jgi:hypothetical protein